VVLEAAVLVGVVLVSAVPEGLGPEGVVFVGEALVGAVLVGAVLVGAALVDVVAILGSGWFLLGSELLLLLLLCVANMAVRRSRLLGFLPVSILLSILQDCRKKDG